MDLLIPRLMRPPYSESPAPFNVLPRIFVDEVFAPYGLESELKRERTRISQIGDSPHLANLSLTVPVRETAASGRLPVHIGRCGFCPLRIGFHLLPQLNVLR